MRSASAWQEVRQANAEADAAEARLATLEAEFEAQGSELEAAMSEEHQAELMFTSESATFLAEYAGEHAKSVDLEEQYTAQRAQIAKLRSSNLANARRSLELDRIVVQGREEMQQAEAAIERFAGSQDGLEADIAAKKLDCEECREASRKQAARFDSDIARFAKLRKRLLEVYSVAAPQHQAEAKRLLERADNQLATVRAARWECDEALPGLGPETVDTGDELVAQLLEAAAATLTDTQLTIEEPAPADAAAGSLPAGGRRASQTSQ